MDKIDINKPKPIGDPNILQISKNIIVETQNFTKRNQTYCDVVLIDVLKNEQKFIGRFIEPQSKVKIKYNSGKILIYNDKFNTKLRKDVIVKVLALYSIIDDVIFAEDEETCLNIFDESIDTSFLKDKNNLTVKIDVERIKIKSLMRV